MFDSSSDEEEALLLLLSLRERTPRTSQITIHDVDTSEKPKECDDKLCRELDTHEDSFYSHFHMSRSSFEELHDLLKSRIAKHDTNYRKAIGTRERLAVCLRYIRTGDSFVKISSSFRFSRSSVSNIVEDVSKAIWECLQPIYIPKPTEETWKQSELGYREIWNFPNCVGGVDGKHVRIECPRDSGSGQEKYSSIALIAIADPFCKFTVTDVGKYGSQNDSGIFENSEFYRLNLHNRVLLPPKPLPGTKDPVPHVLVGDEGFVLQTFLMRPFPSIKASQDPRKQKYNDRLSHARRPIQNTFDILTERWRVFHRPMECHVEKAYHVVKAACCLHNYVRIKHDDIMQTVGSETSSKKFGSNALLPIRRTNARSPNAAIETREKFVTYFNSQ